MVGVTKVGSVVVGKVEEEWSMCDLFFFCN